MLVINFGLNKPILAMLDESVNGSRCNPGESFDSIDEFEQLIINEKSRHLKCRDKYLESSYKYVEYRKSYLESRKSYLESRKKFEHLIIIKRNNCLDSRKKAEQIIISIKSSINKIELLNSYIALILKQL